jgi:signal transduction histidine kinase
MGTPLRVLIIEDSEDDTLLIMHELKRGGYDPKYERVETAGAMNDALNQQEWDIVISDHSMPHFSSFNALDVLKKRGLDLPFFLVSGTIDEEMAVSAMKAGVHDYIMKGNLPRLVPAVQRELREAEMRREHKRMEEEKEKMQAQLIQAQKMEAIGTLAGGVAHDFNNLLTTIQGYAQLAMMSLKESDPFFENFKEIQQASVRAAKLTRQLLLFSRQQPMDLHSITLNETVDNLMKMLKRLIGEDITVQIDLDPNLWTNMADPGNMEQVIMNLVVNARDAMPEGKKITIKTENVDIDEGYCEIYKYAHPGKFVCLSVEDTGVGMDKEIIQHIFDPFFTTKGIGKGTGIGLSVVYGIVKQHEGWINVYSEPGRGSVFKVYLPVSSVESNGEAKEEVISIQDCHGKGERILLVEDDDGIREFAKRVLVESGYVGFEAANAEEALNIFGKEKGDFHLVFSDVVLPEKSGLQLVEQLLCRKPELKVLLTSGYTDQKSQWPVICEKGYRFIQKPYGLTDLLRVVREVIEQGK